jgi:hypothetical protein
VRLAGEDVSGICRLDLYGAWRLLAASEAPDRCFLLLVAEHTRSANPYQLLYSALGIDEPDLASIVYPRLLASTLSAAALVTHLVAQPLASRIWPDQGQRVGPDGHGLDLAETWWHGTRQSSTVCQ